MGENFIEKNSIKKNFIEKRPIKITKGLFEGLTISHTNISGHIHDIPFSVKFGEHLPEYISCKIKYGGERPFTILYQKSKFLLKCINSYNYCKKHDCVFIRNHKDISLNKSYFPEFCCACKIHQFKKAGCTEPSDCSICLEPLTKDLFIPLCHHAIHFNCCIKMEKKNCPLCRNPYQSFRKVKGNWVEVKQNDRLDRKLEKYNPKFNMRPSVSEIEFVLPLPDISDEESVNYFIQIFLLQNMERLILENF